MILSQFQIEKLKEITRAYKKYVMLFSKCAVEGNAYNDSRRLLGILEHIIKSGNVKEDFDYLCISDYTRENLEKIIYGLDNIEIKADWELRFERLKEYVGNKIAYLDENKRNLYNFTIDYDYLCSEGNDLVYDIDLIKDDDKLIYNIDLDLDMYADEVIKKDPRTQEEHKCKTYVLKNYLVEYDSYKIYVNHKNLIVAVELVNK